MRPLIVGVLFFVSPSAPSSPAPAGTAPCLIPDSVTVADRIDYFVTLMRSTAADRAQVREAVGLPNLLEAHVSLVADATTCAGAVQALARLRQEKPVQTGLVVYSLDAAGYAVEDPALVAPAGEYRPVWLFDKAWVYRSTLVGI